MISWYEKFSNPQPQARRLTRLLGMGQKFTDLDLKVKYLEGIKNELADAFSRGPAYSSIDPYMRNKLPSNIDALSYLQVPITTKTIFFRYFQLSTELKSWILSTLLQQDTSKLQQLNRNNLGQIKRAQSITFNFAKTNCDWTLNS